MSRVDAYLELIDDPRAESLSPGHPADALLHRLLVHLAFSDGVVQGDEFALLQRVRPDLDPGELLSWAMEEASQPLEDAALSGLSRTGEDPMDILRFAARMICLDGEVAGEERERLAVLARALRLPETAPGRVIGELVARGGAVSEGRVIDSLRHMHWRRLEPRRGDPEASALSAAAPGGEAVCTLQLDGLEVAALYLTGLLARFEDEVRFIAFEQVGTYTRVPVPGAGFHLHLADGTHLSISDARMADLGALLDYVFSD